jgi:ATP-binding cassette subfamily B protein
VTRPIQVTGDRLLLAASRGNLVSVAALGGASLALAGGMLLLPAAIGHTVDAAIAGYRAGPAGTGTGAGAGPGASTAEWLIICGLLIAVIAAAETVTVLATGTSGATATARLRRLLAGHVIAVGPRLPGSTGDTVSRMIGSAADAGAGPATVVSSVATAIPPLGSVIALGLIDPWLAVAFLLGFPALAFIIRRLARDASQVAADYGRVQASIASRLIDALAGARTIAAAGTQERERQRILAPLPELRRHGYATWRVQARAASQGMIIAPALQVIVLAVAGLELARRQITTGDLLAASQYALLAVGVGASTSMVARLGVARGGARRAAELLSTPAPAYGTAVPVPGAPGELRLRGVTARHPGGGTVLRDLDLTVPGGAVVALVGRSGAGKSTLARLAGRLADPDTGTVILDGTDLRDLTHDSLRTAVTCAFERPHLFGDTPREAIGFGLATPAVRDLVTAAADSQAAAFIERLPAACDTPLRDAPLSGGETQRLGLARAFAHAGEARLLILDDATSSLDTVTEMLVSRALTTRLRGRTRLIVAHRAATAARADLVAWLDEGRIRAVAAHEELWRDPSYRALFACGDLPGERSPVPSDRPADRKRSYRPC